MHLRKQGEVGTGLPLRLRSQLRGGSIMLKTVEIKGLRGIREGTIAELANLVVIVGRNGSGKSTIMEACLIGGARFAAQAVGLVVQRRSQTWNGARWLIHGGSESASALLRVTRRDGEAAWRQLRYESLYAKTAIELLTKRSLPVPYSAIIVERDPPVEGAPMRLAAIAANNEFEYYDSGSADEPYSPLYLVEPRYGTPLHDLYSRSVQSGHRDELLNGAKAVISGLIDMEILTEAGVPRLFLRFAKSVVPATLAGDGLTAMLRTAFELSSPPGGTVLLEEPEVHQHPRTLLWAAKAVVTAVRRGVQVIMTTHSLDLLDKLMAELSDAELQDSIFMSVIRTSLADGVLSAISMSAKEAEAARTVLQEDLR